MFSYFLFCKSILFSTLLNYKTRGHLVTIPEPLGKKSLPTIDSRTDDFPVDYAPTTTIWGNSIEFLVLITLNASYNFITRGIS